MQFQVERRSEKSIKAKVYKVCKVPKNYEIRDFWFYGIERNVEKNLSVS